MDINAYEKFNNAIFTRLSDYELETEREINEIEELEEILKTATGTGWNIELVKSLYYFLDANATEYVYSNGLKYLDSKITFKENENSKIVHTIRQVTVTPDYKKEPITNLIIENGKKSVQEFLIPTTFTNPIIPEEDKTIDINKVVVSVNGGCGSIFERYVDKVNENLLLERYEQYYPLSDYEDSEKDLLRLCGCGSRTLNIVYYKTQPVYAQLSDKYNVEMAGYNPYSSGDVESIVAKINEEVDLITSAIDFEFDKYEWKIKNRQKRLVKSENI